MASILLRQQAQSVRPFIAVLHRQLTMAAQEPTKKAIGLLAYPKMTQLDMTGPLEVLSRVPGATIHVIWKTLDPVYTERSLVIVPDTTFKSCPQLDVILVPGGPGQFDLMEDQETHTFLRKQAEMARYVTSVCTGSLILAAAGLLKGYRATCHWIALPLLEHFNATPCQERIVIDRNRITAAGVSAGIDAGLMIASMLTNEETARKIQLMIEYDPQPPFDSGSVKTASTQLVEVVRGETMKMFEKRLQQVTRMTKG